MIVIKIEIWPRGDESKKRGLGNITIGNDGTGTSEHGNYEVALSHAGIYYGKKGIWKKGNVKGHSRKLSPYHLVHKAIAACLWPKRG